MAGKFEVEGVFKITDRMTRPVGKIESRIEAFQRRVAAGAGRVGQRMSSMWDGATKGFQRFRQSASEPFAAIGRNVKTVGGAALAVGAATGAGLVQIMRTGMDFEKALLSAGNKFEAGISKDSETFKQLSVVAQKVGGSTEFNAIQAANGLRELAGAGLDAGQAMAALPGTVNLATAAEMEDMAAATEIAVKSLGAFGLKAKEPLELAKNLRRVSDVLVKTDDISSTSVPAFFEAIAEGGAIAKTAGADIETYGALVAGLSDIEQGSKAGTTLKNMFLTLSKPTNEAAEALKKFGIKTVDAKGDTRDAIEVLTELKKATSKLGSGDKAGVLEQIFGKIPLAGVMTLMDKIDEVSTNRGKLRTEAGGSVDKKAASMRSGGTGAWDNLTSGLEAVSIAIFQVVGGPINALMNATTEWISTFKDQALPFVKAFVAGFRDGFKQAWPVFQQALDIFRSFFGSTGGWIGTVKTLAHYLGDVAAAAAYAGVILGGVLAGAIRLVVWLVEKWIAAWGYILNAAGAAVFAVMDLLSNLAAKWRAFNFAEWGIQIVKGIANGIKAGAQWVMDAVGNLADEMINKLKGALDMRSPSRRMNKEVGRPAAAGVGVGWVDEMENVNAQIEKSIEASPMVQPVVTQLPRINAMSLGSDMESPELGPHLMSSEERIAGAAAGGDLGHGEIVIRDETGRAEVSEQPKRTKLKIEPARSGQF